MTTTPTSTTQLPHNVIDLAAAVAVLEANLEKDINAQPLYKGEGIHIMLIALNPGAELQKHTAPGPITVQVISGAISFTTDEGPHELTTGHILTLAPNNAHSVLAHERSIFLVTKAMPE